MNSFTEAEKKMFSEMSVCILSPIQWIEPEWVRATVNMVAYSWHNGLKVEEMGITIRQVIDWARNDLVRAGMEKKRMLTGDTLDYTHFLWLDTDHIFNGDLCCQLARHFAIPEVDSVSALYFARTGTYMPVAYVKDFNTDPYKHFPLVEVPNNLCEVDATGFGAILMKRDVFERVPYPWFTLDWRAGEDIAFCVEAKKRGIRFFLDGQYKLGHLGDRQVITEKTYRQYQAEHPEKFADKIKVGLGGKRDGTNLQ